MNDFSDAELIQRYQANQDQSVARELLNRYHGFMLQRLKSALPPADAEDWSQIFWTRFFSNAIVKFQYTDEGCFERYLSKAVTLLKREHWRNAGIQGRILSFASGLVWHGNGAEDEPMELEASTEIAAEHELMARQMINYLVDELVPALPPDQRMIWLLKHEAEFCDTDQSLAWSTLAQLNGMTTEQAWDHFEQTREKLLRYYHGHTHESIESDSLCIYMVWTHSQRPRRQGRYTNAYFSQLLNISENTVKTRYKAAQDKLDAAMNLFLDNGAL